MIEFNGKITEKTKKFFYKATIRMVQYSFYISFIISDISVSVAAISMLDYPIGILALIFGGGLAILWIPPYLLRLSKGIVPSKITITEYYIISTNWFRTKRVELSNVKKVKDYGDFYFIEFPKFIYSTAFVCQKSLMTKGSLEEFVELFEGKIVIVKD